MRGRVVDGSIGRRAMKQDQHIELLRVARMAISRELTGDPTAVTSELVFPTGSGGAFVTLRRDGRLCGCMGTFRPKPSLVETVESVARTSCRDSRFKTEPVTSEELPRITLEVSVLGGLERVADPTVLRVGEHGIVVRRNQSSGCFLPQVATERGWSAEEFLEKCCSMKAGLPADAWKESATEIYIFTAEVFEDRGSN